MRSISISFIATSCPGKCYHVHKQPDKPIEHCPKFDDPKPDRKACYGVVEERVPTEETSTRLNVCEEGSDCEEQQEGKIQSFLAQVEGAGVVEKPEESNDDGRCSNDYKKGVS